MKMRLWIIILLMAFISPVYGEGKKVTQITIEAMIVKTPADNLKDKSGAFKDIDDFFKDPGKVKKIADIPRIVTLAGIEGNVQITKPVYYIAGAEVDENGDIICKLKKKIAGILFKALPRISEETPEVVMVDYQIEVKSFIKRVNPQIPAAADIQELESLWWPIINLRSTKSSVILKNGETVIISGFAGSKPMEDKPEDILELTFLTARW